MTAASLCPQDELQLPPASLRDFQDQQLCLPLSNYCCCSGSVQFSCPVVSDSLRPHELQHAKPPCPSPAPRVYSHSHPSVMPSNHLVLCHPLLLLPSVFPSFRVFSMSQLFASGGQSIGVSASASVPPMNTQD